tara:strand:- start:3669 stop:4685 length:1017 start_codon:yes stop_codon:yes gene_type:complete
MNRVAKLVEIGRIEIEEEVIPTLFLGDAQNVIVKLKAVGICGSDLHYFKEGGLGSFKVPLPMGLGHEPSGEIVESNNVHFPVGTLVALEPGLVCHHCEYCVQGKHNLCKDVEFMSANAPGSFADYISVHVSQCFPVDKERFTPEMAALLEPLGVAAHTLNRLRPEPSSKFAIFGAGPIGLCLANWISHMGHEVTAIVDPLKYRTDIAVEKGWVTNGYNDDEEVKGIDQVDYVIDAAGFQNVIDKCYNVVKPGGKVALVGIPEVDSLEYNPHRMRIKEVDIVNVRRSNQNMDKLIDHYNRWDTEIESIVTHRFPLEDIQKAFEIAAGYEDDILKGMITT